MLPLLPPPRRGLARGDDDKDAGVGGLDEVARVLLLLLPFAADAEAAAAFAARCDGDAAEDAATAAAMAFSLSTGSRRNTTAG